MNLTATKHPPTQGELRERREKDLAAARLKLDDIRRGNGAGVKLTVAEADAAFESLKP